MENFQTRFPVPFFGLGRGIDNIGNRFTGPRACDQMPSATPGSRPIQNVQRPPWGQSQVRPHRVPNMIWSDPRFLNARPQGIPPRPLSGPYPPCGFEQPVRHWRDRGMGRGGRRGCHHQQRDGQRGGGNSQTDQKSASKKKQKIDKRNLPENNQFHCEVCDRGFKTEDKYQEHISEHQQCSVKGCRYIAAPKLVQLHIQTQHRTGLAKKIWSLESPEEIDKWIQERKRNYPTKDNILRKHQVSTERQARGEVIETKEFGRFRGRGRRRGQFRPGDRGHGRDQGRSQTNSPREHTNKNEPCAAGAVGQKRSHNSVPLTGTNVGSGPSPKKPKQETVANGTKVDDSQADGKSLVREKDTSDPLSFLIKDHAASGDESGASSESDDAKPQLLLRGGLASLMSSYHTDSEEEKEEAATPAPINTKEGCETEVPADVTSHSLAAPASEAKGQSWKSQSSSCPSSKVESSLKVGGQGQTPHHQEGARESGRGLAGRGPSQGRRRKPGANIPNRKPTLLERLLANEIRHERNVILQCVHYIVKQNFLGVCDRQ